MPNKCSVFQSVPPTLLKNCSSKKKPKTATLAQTCVSFCWSLHKCWMTTVESLIRPNRTCNTVWFSSVLARERAVSRRTLAHLFTAANTDKCEDVATFNPFRSFSRFLSDNDSCDSLAIRYNRSYTCVKDSIVSNLDMATVTI